MPTSVELMLPTHLLHPGQREVAGDRTRFRVLAAGRRWGKTRLAAFLCVWHALHGRRAWWVGPSYPMTQVGWREIKRLALQLSAAVPVEVREGDRLVRIPLSSSRSSSTASFPATEGVIQVRSAERPDSLRGEGLDFVVLDECAFMREEAWTEALRPALSDRRGRALFISTPKGRNWFWRLWRRGWRGDGDDGEPSPAKAGGQAALAPDPDWRSWQLPSTANPHLDPAEVAAARAALPERVFRQEYLAEFVEDGGGVFRGVLAAATAVWQEEPVPGHQYVVGVDWGKHQDFTVFAVLDATLGAVVYLDRMSRVDYALQRGRLLALVDRFRPEAIVAERNAMGEPIVEDLVRAGLPVQPFLTTAVSKAQAIEALALALERGELAIPSYPPLIEELTAYEAHRLPSGLVRYQAPAGMHDDCVMAVALAWQAARPPGGGMSVWALPLGGDWELGSV